MIFHIFCLFILHIFICQNYKNENNLSWVFCLNLAIGFFFSVAFFCHVGFISVEFLLMWFCHVGFLSVYRKIPATLHTSMCSGMIRNEWVSLALKEQCRSFKPLSVLASIHCTWSFCPRPLLKIDTFGTVLLTVPLPAICLGAFDEQWHWHHCQSAWQWGGDVWPQVAWWSFQTKIRVYSTVFPVFLSIFLSLQYQGYGIVRVSLPLPPAFIII